ncbi:MAG: hypothetical protein DMG22_07380 [Acidobacteria bacterium]|nr:MAG: hypothetical protein DMG22_07380 [Acidobacteriota bacterium]
MTHQAAVEMTRRMKLVLGVDHLGDRRDVIAKYNQLLDNWRRNPKAFRQASQSLPEKQSIADQVGLYAVAAAGYSPEASADIFDRFTGLQGKTGNWVSDFFGATKPEAKRLREMLKTIPKLPASCIEKRADSNGAEFKNWAAAVIDFTAWNQEEILHNVVARTPLMPQLRDRIRRLRFSPDGRYILAQDSAQIYILSREPLQALFQIDAPDTLDAQFSPDSQSVVFNDKNLRVEKWDVATGKRVEAHEVVLYPGCLDTALSSDGRCLACLSSDESLRLVEVASGHEVFRKQYFEPFLIPSVLFTSVYSQGLRLPLLSEEMFRFSPDAKYFLGRGNETVAYDLSVKKEISIKGPLGSMTRFAFLGPDRVLVGKGRTSLNSAIVSFPSGQVISEGKAPAFAWQAATHGDYIIWFPQTGARVAVFSLASGESVLSSKVLTAMDIYDQTLVSEARDGEIGLLKVETRQPFAQVTLPSGSLSGLEAVAVSPSLNWLAVSNRERAAFWNLTNGVRTYFIRGFRGAYMPDESACYAEFPKFEEAPHSIEYLSLTSQSIQRVSTLDSDHVRDYGSVYVVPKWEGGQPRPGAKLTMEVYDVRVGKLLWSREFRKVRPDILMRSGSNRMLFLWDLASDDARNEIKSSIAGKEELGSVTYKKGDYLVEVVETQTGNRVRTLVVRTGKLSFDVEGGFASADWVVVADNSDRLHVYSLADGNEQATLFGRRAAVSESRKLLAAENGRHLTLFDLGSLEERDDFTFKSPIVFTEFSSDGKRLLVLTRDQSAYTLNVSGAP